MKEDIHFLDWFVIGAYMIGMLAVGWFYSRRIKTTNDYFLGGRSMRPWAVGLSLFASLLSTLSYLAFPGETIKHGPMIAAQIASYPIIIIVVCWLIIPKIMRLEVTSAYEILEKRLGSSVRILGSLIFLVMRLLWMAVIIYATTSKILVPLLGWSEGAIPWVCAVLGILTVIYTSMGGLRAVVLTDVIQTFILFGGAVLAVLLISIKTGGVAAWWPTEWGSNWDPPVLWFDTKARITVTSAALSSLIWIVCTAGSDQMAVQRYLATRDVKSARRMFIMNMSFGAIVQLFLVILGFALLGFFRSNPELLPAGKSLNEAADQLFTYFIVSYMPVGLTGLVVAGLLAAAMSSLSSGVNSSCAVITRDFAERYFLNGQVDHVRLAKITSWLVGTAVVILSCLVAYVPGNLMEVNFKVTQLLTVPLFILFFVAMFVPWGTAFGAWTACLSSTAVAIGVAFFGLFGLSFIWITPGALITGIIIGMVASFIPIRKNLTHEA